MAPSANTASTIAPLWDSRTSAVTMRPIATNWQTIHTNRPRLKSAAHETSPIHRNTAYS